MLILVAVALVLVVVYRKKIGSIISKCSTKSEKTNEKEFQTKQNTENGNEKEFQTKQNTKNEREGTDDQSIEASNEYANVSLVMKKEQNNAKDDTDVPPLQYMKSTDILKKSTEESLQHNNVAVDENPSHDYPTTNKSLPPEKSSSLEYMSSTSIIQNSVPIPRKRLHIRWMLQLIGHQYLPVHFLCFA